MTFLEAVRAASNRKVDDVAITRPNGPIFQVDHLGQMTLILDCLYLGDILDFNDWIVTDVISATS